jgi:chaperonin cofactor prefoldin
MSEDKNSAALDELEEKLDLIEIEIKVIKEFLEDFDAKLKEVEESTRW